MNPFVQNIKLNVIQVNESFTIVNNGRGNGATPKAEVTVPNHYYIEEVAKTSIYQNKDLTELLFCRLGPAGRDLLWYMTAKLKKNEDYFRMNQPVICAEMGNISRGKLHTGITQLTDAGVICRRDTKTYWLNPIYLYNGSRINYFLSLGPDHIKVVANV